MTSLGVVKVPDGLPEQLGSRRLLLSDPGAAPDRRVLLDLPRARQPGRLAQRLRRRPRDRRRHAPLGVHARSDRHDAAHRRRAPASTRSSSPRARRRSCRTGSAPSPSRTSRRPGPRGTSARSSGSSRCRSTGMLVGSLGARLRRARDPGSARGALRAASADLGEGRPRRGIPCASSTRASRAARIPTLDDAVGQFAQRHGDALEAALATTHPARPALFEPDLPGVGCSMPETAPLSLDSVSVLLVWTAIAVYALAFIAYASTWRAARRRPSTRRTRASASWSARAQPAAGGRTIGEVRGRSASPTRHSTCAAGGSAAAACGRGSARR